MITYTRAGAQHQASGLCQGSSRTRHLTPATQVVHGGNGPQRADGPREHGLPQPAPRSRPHPLPRLSSLHGRRVRPCSILLARVAEAATAGTSTSSSAMPWCRRPSCSTDTLRSCWSCPTPFRSRDCVVGFHRQQRHVVQVTSHADEHPHPWHGSRDEVYATPSPPTSPPPTPSPPTSTTPTSP